ncbi:RNA-directed DNA polymerase, eukaryota [Tanacetum coccineum]
MTSTSWPRGLSIKWGMGHTWYVLTPDRGDMVPKESLSRIHWGTTDKRPPFQELVQKCGKECHSSKDDRFKEISRYFTGSVNTRTGGSILSVMEENYECGSEEVPIGGKFLSDHRPILLREASFDYGPTPFLVFHFWFDVDDYRNNFKGSVTNFKEELRILDELIDKGNGSDEIVNNRLEILGKLQQVNKAQASEVAQKAKIKWFDKPPDQNAHIDMPFSNSLSVNVLARKDLSVWFLERRGKRAFFFTCGEIPKGCNSTFIALIPKNPDANMVKDFRPISLIGSIYKIIAKILTNRLVGVLGDIVNEVQSAFISERQILDGPFILNEIMQWCRRRKKQSLIFKVDFEKAYDSVRWDFLDDILVKFGFGIKWRGWIQNCLNSSKGSILVNGSPTEEFQFYKGLKQGDPLSPFLFILVMESLHISFQRVVDVGMFTGIKLSSSLNISHLFYADDAIFLGQWNDSNIDTLVHVMECFYRVSGLRINLCKSKIMGIHVDADRIKSAASKLGCLVLNTPFLYLGTKVGENRVHAWKEVMVKIKSRLSNWKLKTLSIGGRFTLLKSVLVSTITLSSAVDRYVWSLENSGVLWSRVIKAIHGPEGGLITDVRRGFRSTWTSIVQEVKKLQNQGVLKDVFPRLLVSTITLSSAVDRYVWSLENSGEFSVKSIRQVIDANCFPVIHSATRWVKSVPLKVNIMAWKIKMDGLPTRMNISRHDSWLGKYRLSGMWITLMFLLMRNGTLGWYLLGFRQISKRCSKASSIVYGGRFGCSEQEGIFCLGYKVRDNKFLGVHFFDVKERHGIDSKGFLEFFDCPGSRQGVEDLREVIRINKGSENKSKTCRGCKLS